MSKSPAPALSMSGYNWLLLVLLSLLWGAAFFFNKLVVNEIPPLTGALGRVGIAALLLIALSRASGVSLENVLRRWPAFLLLGLLHNVLPFSLILWGQQYIPSGLASILNATTPLFTTLVAHIATSDDKLTPARVAGLIAGFLGVVVMLAPDLRRALDASVAAQFACLLAALIYGVAGVYARRFKHEAPLAIATGQLAASTLILLPAVALIDRSWLLPMPTLQAWSALGGLAVLSTALAFIVYFRILNSAGATNALLVTFLVPVSAILLGAVFLGERLALHHFAGMAAIALGLAAIDGRPAKWLAQRVGTGFSPR
jgi:drug/metabolite transporter (DMT)-like permease